MSLQPIVVDTGEVGYFQIIATMPDGDQIDVTFVREVPTQISGKVMSSGSHVVPTYPFAGIPPLWITRRAALPLLQDKIGFGKGSLHRLARTVQKVLSEHVLTARALFINSMTSLLSHRIHRGQSRMKCSCVKHSTRCDALRSGRDRYKFVIRQGGLQQSRSTHRTSLTYSQSVSTWDRNGLVSRPVILATGTLSSPDSFRVCSPPCTQGTVVSGPSSRRRIEHLF
jgi:hypothetical protein